MNEATPVEGRPVSFFDTIRARVDLQDSALAIVVVVLIIVGAALKPGTFLTSSNLLNVLVQASGIGIVAIGMTFVIATGGIDLSVGSSLAAATIIGATISDFGPFFIVCTIAAAVLIGAVNGAAVVLGRIAPFIATLAMLTIARGLALRVSNQTPIPMFDGFVEWLGTGKIVGVPFPAILLVLVAGLGWLVLNRTAYGRHAVAVGGNKEAARIAGIRVGRTTFIAYLIAGACVGIAGVVLTGRLGSASPVTGNLLELDAIAAVVIGGSSLAGGRATIVGTSLGVITFALIFNLLNLLNLPAELQLIVKGVIVLAAVALQRGRNR